MLMLNKIYPLLFVALFILPLTGNAQDEDDGDVFIYQTFKSTRLINVHTTETLEKRTLDVRIGHRFGDLVGPNGGWETFFGLEDAADVMIGVEYGLTNDITIGLLRTKSSGELRRNMNGLIKYRFLKQKEKGMPITMAFVGLATMSTQKKLDNPEAIASFPEFKHRFAYSAQLIFARKFGERFSLEIIPGYVHRNLVPFGDQNGIFSIGTGARLQLSKVFGIIAESTIPFSDIRTRDNNFYPSVGVGLEIETGGHIFQLNFTNSEGIMETDYIPYTRSSWLDGGFRLGFTISRVFNL